MLKSKLADLTGNHIHIKNTTPLPLRDILLENRNIAPADIDTFFHPQITDLHDPFLMPDMQSAIDRILIAQKKGERIIIFGDYDVDGVSATALLFRFFQEIGIVCSYRLPHRVHDGYGLKEYFFDELAQKNVKLVITVDCGTRDISVIQYAQSLGIDVIVTDHHAVPDQIPEGVPIVNPKRKDSLYPFSGLAGAGVALKLVHGILLTLKKDATLSIFPEDFSVEDTLLRYLDFASLGTVADCMPLIGENRVITTLGLRQMRESQSSALRQYIKNLDRDTEGDADIIGYQIGPRINAAGRMDSPLKALQWLLADESRVDGWLQEIESLNSRRQEVVKEFTKKALEKVDTTAPVLFYLDNELEHGLIGLVAGRLTEEYARPTIVLCPHESGDPKKSSFVASCRSPHWCNLVELLDECKEFFVRYGGHRQAAGFTIEPEKFDAFQQALRDKFTEKYGALETLPKKTIEIDTVLDPQDLTQETLEIIDQFRPFGIGNPRPLFLLENVTITESRALGALGVHLSLRIAENPDIKILYWGGGMYQSALGVGNILSLGGELEKNIWNGKVMPQFIVRTVIDGVDSGA